MLSKFIYIWLTVIYLIQFNTSLLGQSTRIQGVRFLLKSDITTCLYNVNIVCVGGNATSGQHWTQFNTKNPFITDAADSFETVNHYIPLYGNTCYYSTLQGERHFSNLNLSPARLPQGKIYSIIPKVTPFSPYNNVKNGENIKSEPQSDYNLDRYTNRLLIQKENTVGRNIFLFVPLNGLLNLKPHFTNYQTYHTLGNEHKCKTLGMLVNHNMNEIILNYFDQKHGGIQNFGVYNYRVKQIYTDEGLDETDINGIAQKIEGIILYPVPAKLEATLGIQLNETKDINILLFNASS